MLDVAAVVFADVAHERRALTLFLSAHKLHQVHWVVVASRGLTGLLADGDPAVFSQGARGVSHFRALDAKVSAARDAKQHGCMRFIFITRNCKLKT